MARIALIWLDSLYLCLKKRDNKQQNLPQCFMENDEEIMWHIPDF